MKHIYLVLTIGEQREELGGEKKNAESVQRGVSYRRCIVTNGHFGKVSLRTKDGT